MQGLEVSGAVRLIYGSLGVKRLKINTPYILDLKAIFWSYILLQDNYFYNAMAVQIGI